MSNGKQIIVEQTETRKIQCLSDDSKKNELNYFSG